MNKQHCTSTNHTARASHVATTTTITTTIANKCNNNNRSSHFISSCENPLSRSEWTAPLLSATATTLTPTRRAWWHSTRPTWPKPSTAKRCWAIVMSLALACLRTLLRQAQLQQKINRQKDAATLCHHCGRQASERANERRCRSSRPTLTSTCTHASQVPRNPRSATKGGDGWAERMFVLSKEWSGFMMLQQYP